MLADFTTLEELLGLKIALISNPTDMICIMSLEYFLNQSDYDYTELKSFVENENLDSQDVYILQFAETTDNNDIWEDILDLEYEVIIEFNLVDFLGQKKTININSFCLY